MAYQMLDCTVYFYIVSLGVNVRFCCVPRVWVGQSVDHAGCGRACPCEGIGAAQCAGQPVPAGDAPDQGGCVGAGHPGRGDEQRAARGSAHDRHPAGRGAEPGLGHLDHRDAGLGVRMAAQAGPGRWGPGRRSRRPPAGPARADRAGPRPMRGAGQGNACAPGRPPRILPSAEARARRATRLPAAGVRSGRRGARGLGRLPYARDIQSANPHRGRERLQVDLPRLRGVQRLQQPGRAERQPGLAALPGPSLAATVCGTRRGRPADFCPRS